MVPAAVIIVVATFNLNCLLVVHLVVKQVGPLTSIQSIDSNKGDWTEMGQGGQITRLLGRRGVPKRLFFQKGSTRLDSTVWYGMASTGTAKSCKHKMNQQKRDESLEVL